MAFQIGANRGFLVDLIHQIGEMLALSDHFHEIRAEEALILVVKARREAMKTLIGQMDDPNLEWWCAFKHAVKAWTLACELYEANPCEKTRKNEEKCEEIMGIATANLLGVEWTGCARCLFDELTERTRNGTDDSNEQENN